MARRIDQLITVSDLDLMPDDGNRYEAISGELLVSKAPGLTHQSVLINITVSLWLYLKQNPIGKVFSTPGVILSQFDGVIPDLVFVSNDRLADITANDRLQAAPDLAIEIVPPGPDNSRRDRILKRQMYAKFGVSEYWVVDPALRTVEVYELNEQTLSLIRTFSEYDEITSSTLPGYTTKVSEFFES